MKLISKPLFGLFAGVAGAAIVLSISHLTSWGRDGQPAFNVSATPINRDARPAPASRPSSRKSRPAS